MLWNLHILLSTIHRNKTSKELISCFVEENITDLAIDTSVLKFNKTHSLFLLCGDLEMI